MLVLALAVPVSGALAVATWRKEQARQAAEVLAFGDAEEAAHARVERPWTPPYVPPARAPVMASSGVLQDAAAEDEARRVARAEVDTHDASEHPILGRP